MFVLLSAAHARGLAAQGRLLHMEVEDPLMEERVLRIRAQVTFSLVLRELLTDMGFDLPNTLDLLPLAVIAQREGVLNRREFGIILSINRMANDAKHLLVFQSRL
jgi:hypothetical protein